MRHPWAVRQRQASQPVGARQHRGVGSAAQECRVVYAGPMSVTSPASLATTPLSGTVGAQIDGLDLSEPLADDVTQAVRQAFVEHGVLVFRDQQLTPEQQVAFGHSFGELDFHPFVEMNRDYPEVLDVITVPDDRMNFGGGWHCDVTFMGEPDLGSILYAVEVPEFGGDTLFASQAAAYEALSDTMRSMVDGLTAVHTAGLQYTEGGTSTTSKAMVTRNAEQASEKVEHPVVRTHPESGRKSIYVNRAFTTHIVGLKRTESQALLNFLFDHAVLERFTCRIRWEPGTLVMWDNRSVQHHALFDYAGQRRHMRRITVKGDRPV